MSTRSRIGIIRTNGSIESIYCHFDGYLEGNGKVLFEHYQDFDKIQDLIHLGSISALRENVAPLKGTKHTFENPQDDVVIAYMRDRGEKKQKAIVSSGVREFTELCKNSWSDFAYLYSVENKTWKWAGYRMINSIVFGNLQERLESLKIIEPQPIRDSFYKSSFIGTLKNDGSIHGIHCMFDGYPEWTGKLLYENYHSKKDTDILLENGNIKSLSHLDDRKGVTKENYDFVNVDTLNEHCKSKSIGYTYLYDEQGEKWFLYERKYEQAIIVEPLKQYLEVIGIIGEGKVQESKGINPVTYPHQLYEKYPDNFGDLRAVYSLLHKMREGASVGNQIVGYANVCIIIDEYCKNDHMIHDYVQLLQGHINDDRFTYIQNEIDSELDLQLGSITNQKM